MKKCVYCFGVLKDCEYCEKRMEELPMSNKISDTTLLNFFKNSKVDLRLNSEKDMYIATDFSGVSSCMDKEPRGALKGLYILLNPTEEDFV